MHFVFKFESIFDNIYSVHAKNFKDNMIFVNDFIDFVDSYFYSNLNLFY